MSSRVFVIALAAYVSGCAADDGPREPELPSYGLPPALRGSDPIGMPPLPPLPVDDIPAACLEPVSEPPLALGLDPFYTQYLDVRGIPVVGSTVVVGDAFLPACMILDHMLAGRPDIVAELVGNGVRFAIIAESELLTELPEYSDLEEEFPDSPRPWSEMRGVGATHDRPLASTGEENILQLAWPRDKHRGDSIIVHEFAHTMFDLGWADVPGEGMEVVAKLDELYDAAVEAGTWNDTYAATNSQEYWAMGVQIWYDAANEAIPADGIHNHIDTRAELWSDDPELAELIADVFADDDFHPFALPSYE